MPILERTKASPVAEKMMRELVEAHMKVLEKFMRKYEDKANTRDVITGMQGAAINFLTAVSRSSASYMGNMGIQLEFMDSVLRDVEFCFDEAKKKIRSVDLN
jgi:hypothetical protein